MNRLDLGGPIVGHACVPYALLGFIRGVMFPIDTCGLDTRWPLLTIVFFFDRHFCFLSPSQFPLQITVQSTIYLLYNDVKQGKVGPRDRLLEK